MNGPTTTLDVDALLAQEDFVRLLARDLLADPHGADDVVQQAWLRAVERPPREPSALRSWLGVVVRNLVRNQKAADAVRARHEAAAAHCEAVPSAAEIFERETLRRAVVEAAVGLPAPYRGVVLLRYFEDLLPAEIAARLSIPGSTVRTRLSRGLEMLRERMDAASGGDRRSWALALIPVARPLWRTGAVLLWTIGGLTMKKTTVALAVGCLLLGGVAFGLFAGDEAQPVLADDTVEPIEFAAAVRETQTPVEVVDRKVRPAPGVIPKARPHAGAARVKTPTGHLRHLDGTPAVGVAYAMEWGATGPDVQSEDPDVFAIPSTAPRTGSEGEFSIELRRATTGVLWFGDHGQQFGFVLGSRRHVDWHELRLPRLGTVSIRGYGLKPRARFHVDIRPVRAAVDPGHRDFEKFLRQDPDRLVRKGAGVACETLVLDRRALSSASRARPDCEHLPDFAVLRAMTSRTFEAGKGEVTLLAGALFEFTPHGEDFAMRQRRHRAPWVRPPGSIRFKGGTTTPTADVVVYDPLAREPTTMDGVLVSGAMPSAVRWRERGVLERGRSRLGFQMLRADETQRVWVLMADGEYFAAQLDVVGHREQRRLEFFRGQGHLPRRVTWPRDSLRGELLLMVEDDKGRLVRGIPWRRFTFPDGTSFAFNIDGFAEDFTVRLIRPPDNIVRVWVLTSAGIVGVAPAPRGASRTSLGRWFPHDDLPALDLGAAWQRHARGRAAEVKFQVELTAANGDRHWVTLDVVVLRAAGRGTWWKKTAGSLRRRFLMRVQKHDRVIELVPGR